MTDWIKTFLREGIYNAGTRHQYAIYLNYFLLFVGNLKVTQIKLCNILQFEHYLIDTRGKGTALNALVAVRSFFKFLTLKYDLKVLNYQAITLRPVSHIPHAYINEEKINKIIKLLPNLRNKLIIALLYSTGCRANELLNIKLTDIDCDKSQITILGKGDKYREVYITPKCRKLLKSYISTRRDDCEYLFVTEHHSRFHQEARRISGSNLRMLFYRLSKQTGLHLHAHQLRKSFATELYRRSNDIYKVSKLCGHTSVVTTQKYAIVEDEELKDFHTKFTGDNHELIFEKKHNGRTIMKLSGWVSGGQKRQVEKAIKCAIDKILK